MKTKFYISVILIFLLSVVNYTAYAQGCVAVRNMASCSALFDSVSNDAWQFSVNYRYFKSFRHFTGKEEDKERIEENTNVINHDNSIILGVTYNINSRWAAAISVPMVYIDRSSRPRDANNQRLPERHYTNSKGIGDIRLTAYYSVIPKRDKGNLLFGLGIKLPTGDYKYEDEALVNGVYVTRPVDQSIQPGDGGMGIITEVDFAREIFSNGYAYVNGSYLFNPRNTNGVKTNRSNPFEDVMSVADQFFLRAGVRYMYKGFQLGVGGRYEGIPVSDAIGKSDGFRRPGYIISVEPTLVYSSGKHAVGVNVPIALVRNRTKSVADKNWENQENEPKHGDAAFADWLLSMSYAYKLSR